MFFKSDSKSQELFYWRVKANRWPVNTLLLRKVFKPVGVGQMSLTRSGSASLGGKTGAGKKAGPAPLSRPHVQG
jgi:hypothetical protein